MTEIHGWWGPWDPKYYKNKNCPECGHQIGYVSDGFYRCNEGKEERIVLPFAQFHPTDCDKFEEVIDDNGN